MTKEHERLWFIKCSVIKVFSTLHSDILQTLLHYAEAEDFAGYDPYDTLNSWIPFHWFGKWGPVLAIQFQKRNPINIRPLLGIRKERNPKAIGLFLRAYSLLYQRDPRPEYLERMRALFTWLREHPSSGYSEYCWGYNFPWASPVKYLPAYMPSVVATGFVVKGLFEYWRATTDPEVLPLLRGAADFVLQHVERHEDECGICFSYTPVMKDACYNASLLGAEILAKCGNTEGTEGRDRVRMLVRRAVDFVVARQKDDGCWNYSMDIETGKERAQIDFHQGYVIESIEEIMRVTGERPPAWEQAVRKGLDYYRHTQFLDDGRSLWRVPKQWPVEIHNQAQGIITFAMFDAYRSFAPVIAEWTQRNMYDSRGFFHHQHYQRHSIRIPYMRWSQAWMAVALAVSDRKHSE